MTGFLDELLNAYWLRPETALWRACDIRALGGFSFEPPSLDLGCGDGIFSFIRAGGRLAESFDVFQSVAHLDQYFRNVDVYDAWDAEHRAAVLQPPGYRVSVGLDHKENLLRKALATTLYEKTVVADSNLPLPFPAGAFRSVFSNIVYWLDDPARCLAEIARVLSPGGSAAILLPNTDLPAFSFYATHYQATGDPRFKFLELLDRGRFAENIKHARTYRDWKRMIDAAGLEVEHHAGHLSRLTVQVWDVGLRPLFPALLAMVRHLPSDKLLEVKREWIQTVRMFAAPIWQADPGLCRNGQHGFHCFVLRRPGR